jgi:hypothetical protein
MKTRKRFNCKKCGKFTIVKYVPCKKCQLKMVDVVSAMVLSTYNELDNAKTK